MTFTRLISLVIAIWIVAALSIWLSLPDWQSRGQFGDLFGAVNALFSGLAFAGLYFAIRLQQDQLVLQRTELALQREELKLQREEMAASRTELANQVAAQQALFRATAAQVTVASAQAKIEAIKIQAEHTSGHTRASHIANINSLAEELQELAKSVQSDDETIG